MGRKSSAKKQRKIEEKDEAKNPKQTKKSKRKFFKRSKKNPKKNTKKVSAPLTKPEVKGQAQHQAEKPRTKTPLKPQKIFGTLLALIMTTILIVVAVQLFQKNFRPTPLADLLPAEATSALVEINTYADHTQLTKAKELLSQTEYSTENLAKLIEEKLKLNPMTTATKWLGRQVGAAEIEIDPEKPLKTVYFVEVTNKKEVISLIDQSAEAHLNTLVKTEDKDQALYSWTIRSESNNRDEDYQMHASFLEEYLIISKDYDVLLFLINNNKDKRFQVVSDLDSYDEVSSETPFNKIGFLFINQYVANEKLQAKYSRISGQSIYIAAQGPLSNLSKAEGMALIAKDNHFEIRNYTALKDDYLSGNRYTRTIRNYKANLAKFIPQNQAIVWGGENIETQIKRLVALLSEGSTTTNEIFEGVIQNYVEKYLGGSIQLEEDIFDLMDNEFLLSLEQKSDKEGFDYTMLIELDSPSQDALTIQKIAQSFSEVGAVFEPKIQEIELEDGTKAKEIVAIPSTLMKSETVQGDNTIYKMETEDGGFGMFYAIQLDKVIISTNLKTLEKSLSLAANESDESILKDPKFAKLLGPSLQASDELIYIDSQALYPETKLMKSLSLSRQYFDSGFNSYFFINVE